MNASFSVTPTSVLPGGSATFTAVIENTGDATLTGPVTLKFSTEGGNVLFDTTNATATVGEVKELQPNLEWTGSVAKGQKVTITLDAEVRASSPAGTIVSDIVAPTGWDVTGTTQASVDVTLPSNIVTDVSYSIAAPKPNTAMRAIVTFENTGGTAYTADEVATFTFDPTGSFDIQKAEVTDGEGDATVSGNVVTVKGSIPAGGTRKLEITVSVLSAATEGNTAVVNVTKPTGETSGKLTATATVAAALTRAGKGKK